MAYQTFNDFNNTGLDGLFLYPAEIIPLFIPLVLFSIFTITMMGTLFSQSRLSNRRDFYASFAVASFFTTVIAFVMTLIPGLINLTTLVVCIVLSIIGIILLLTSRDK